MVRSSHEWAEEDFGAVAENIDSILIFGRMSPIGAAEASELPKIIYASTADALDQAAGNTFDLYFGLEALALEIITLDVNGEEVDAQSAGDYQNWEWRTQTTVLSPTGRVVDHQGTFFCLLSGPKRLANFR